MAVESTLRKQQYSLNQTTSTFAFTFRALTAAPTDIKAIATTGSSTKTLTYTTDYTVDVADDGVGGTLTLVDPTAISKGTLTIYRETTDTQESDYDDYNQFPADTLETDLDKRTMKSQEVAEDIARSLKLPVSSTTTDLEVPEPEATKILGWNAAADGLTNYPGTATDAAAAAASASAAAGSATTASSHATTALGSASAASASATTASSHATTALGASTTASSHATTALGAKNDILAMPGSINLTIDGGSTAIATGVMADMEIPFDCTLTAWTLLGDASGAVKIDVWKDTYGNYPPTDADSITNGHEPEIAASGVKAQDTDLSDWTTTAIPSGSTLRFNVDSCATITRVVLSLKYSRT